MIVAISVSVSVVLFGKGKDLQIRSDYLVRPSLSRRPPQVCSMTGVGMLSLAYAMHLSGVIFMVVGMPVMAVLMCATIIMMLNAAQACDVVSYEGLMMTAFGNKGRYIVDGFLIFSLFFTLVAYVVIVGDFTSDVYWRLFMDETTTTVADAPRAWTTITTMLVTSFPLTLLRSLNSLRFSSIVAILSALYFCGILLYFNLSTRINEPQRLPPAAFAPPSGGGVLQALPMVVFAFATHHTVFPVIAEMKVDVRKKHRNKAILVAFAVVMVMYFVVSLCGYLLFGDETASNLILSLGQLDSAQGAFVSILVCYAFVILLAYPLVNFVHRLVVVDLIFHDNRLSTERG